MFGVRFVIPQLKATYLLTWSSKGKAALHLPQPKTRTELRSVLSILNFFRSHIPDYAEIAKPLTDALSSKKNPAHKGN